MVSRWKTKGREVIWYDCSEGTAQTDMVEVAKASAVRRQIQDYYSGWGRISFVFSNCRQYPTTSTRGQRDGGHIGSIVYDIASRNCQVIESKSVKLSGRPVITFESQRSYVAVVRPQYEEDMRAESRLGWHKIIWYRAIDRGRREIWVPFCR